MIEPTRSPLPLPPECYGRHTSSEYCPSCAAWSAFVGMPRLLEQIRLLLVSIEDVLKSRL